MFSSGQSINQSINELAVFFSCKFGLRFTLVHFFYPYLLFFSSVKLEFCSDGVLGFDVWIRNICFKSMSGGINQSIDQSTLAWMHWICIFFLRNFRHQLCQASFVGYYFLVVGALCGHAAKIHAAGPVDDPLPSPGRPPLRRPRMDCARLLCLRPIRRHCCGHLWRYHEPVCFQLASGEMTSRKASKSPNWDHGMNIVARIMWMLCSWFWIWVWVMLLFFCPHEFLFHSSFCLPFFVERKALVLICRKTIPFFIPHPYGDPVNLALFYPVLWKLFLFKYSRSKSSVPD